MGKVWKVFVIFLNLFIFIQIILRSFYVVTLKLLYIILLGQNLFSLNFLVLLSSRIRFDDFLFDYNITLHQAFIIVLF